MPLETVFAALQHQVGIHFLRNSVDCKTRALHAKVLELWPRHAACLRKLILGLPHVMSDIIKMQGASTGR